jgi:hypothetical protein
MNREKHKQKYRKEHEQIFSFVHSNQRELVLEVDDAERFINCRFQTMLMRYKDILYFMSLDGNKVLVVKK